MSEENLKRLVLFLREQATMLDLLNGEISGAGGQLETFAWINRAWAAEIELALGEET